MAKKVLPQDVEGQFQEVLGFIESARARALQKVNSELVELYWKLGEYISLKMSSSEWGDFVVKKLAEFLFETRPDLKGFSRSSLYRMKQFYETYANCEIVAPLVGQISWTHNLIILSKCKTEQEREFYIKQSIEERYGKRELTRQIDSSHFERSSLPKAVLKSDKAFGNRGVETFFKDQYVFEFLDLPERHLERDLQKRIVKNLKTFILEIGSDFTFMGEEYRLQIGNKDFSIDLLFFHRELQCLVAFELKIGSFEPSHLGQLEFYLKVLDKEVKKPNENPSIGILLCRDKDNEVVEIALQDSIKPTLVAEYETKLIDKEILRSKFHELLYLNEDNE